MATKKPRKDKWKTRWEVESFSELGKKYTVAQDWDGNYGCSCKGWIFHLKKRGEHCKHIAVIIQATDKAKAALLLSEQKMPVVTLTDWTIRVLEDFAAPAERTTYVPMVMQPSFGDGYDE